MKKLKAAPNAFPATTPDTGLTPVTGTQFRAGDRGCLPIILNSAAASQLKNRPLTLVPLTGFNLASVFNDYGNWVDLLCSTSGTCCTTNLCNPSGRIEMNLATAFLSSAFMLIGLMNF